MFCSKCGAADQNGSFCASCGASLGQSNPVNEQPVYQAPAQPAYGQPVYDSPYASGYAQPYEAPKKKNRLLPILIAAGAVVLVVILLILLLGGNKQEKIAEDYIEAVFMNDMDALEDLMAPALYDYLGSDLDFGYGADRCEVEAVDCEACSEEDLEGYNSLLLLFGSDEEATEAYSVTVEYTIWMDDEDASDETIVIVGKLDGEWCVISMG